MWKKRNVYRSMIIITIVHHVRISRRFVFMNFRFTDKSISSGEDQ